VVLVWAGLFLGCSDDTTAPPRDAARDVPRVEQGVFEAGAREAGAREAGAKEAGAKEAGAGDAATVSFSQQVQPIFTASCLGASCHSTGATAPDLTAGKAHAALVNVTSTQCPTLKEVTPSQPTQSYLMQKLNGSGSCFTGQKMPPAGLTAAQITLIQNWITAGAPNN